MAYNEPRMEPIPWNYQHATEAGQFNIWEWTTDHFTAKILEDGNRYVFSVVDVTQDYDNELVSSTCAKLEEAVNYIREAVSKSYPPTAGYLKFGGILAHSFYIADGTFRNFGPAIGMQVSLFAKQDGKVKKFNGRLDVLGKRIILHQPDGKAFKVPPNLISDVRAYSGEKINLEEVDLNKKKSRTIKGKFESGCSGHIGFMAGTVEHPASAPFCTVHRI